MDRHDSGTSSIPHATERLPRWEAAWKESGLIVLLLDFDGTLAPIVPHADDAALPEETREALQRLERLDTVRMALVSGRGMDDVRERVGMDSLAYAGNHGMEISGPSLSHRHEAAAAARPSLDEVVRSLQRSLDSIDGAWIEDKGVTLSIHYREVPDDRIDDVRRAVDEATAGVERIRVTSGKKVFEIRPDVDWDKGRAVEFLLDRIDPPVGAPVLYIGDDTTDEDAFEALGRWREGAGEGVVVEDPPPPDSAAKSYLRSTAEVASLLDRIARMAD